jgi:hypothetical protein
MTIDRLQAYQVQRTNRGKQRRKPKRYRKPRPSAERKTTNPSLPIDPRRRWAAIQAHQNRSLKFWKGPEEAPSAATIVSGSNRARHTRWSMDKFETSIVVDPPDGHVPPYNAAARKRLAAERARPTPDARESQDPTAEPPGAFDNPEQRPKGFAAK